MTAGSRDGISNGGKAPRRWQPRPALREDLPLFDARLVQGGGDEDVHAPRAENLKLFEGAVFPRPLTWAERLANYKRVTGYPSALFESESGQVVGTWVMGNNYQVASSYYGGYPHGYLARVSALFFDKQRVCHLFSGRVDTTIVPGDTVDINPALNPTFVADAQSLADVPLEGYDLVLADPPYSVEDCDHYGVPMVNRNNVLRTLGQRLTPGTHVAWLDQVLPMYRKQDFAVEAYVGIVKSTNHRFRLLTVFRKRDSATSTDRAGLPLEDGVESQQAKE